VAGVKIGSGSLEPAARPAGSLIPQTVPSATIFGQARSRQPAADDALEGDHVGLSDEHRPAAKWAAIDRGREPHRIDVGRDQMMRDRTRTSGEPIEPER
jgi:hypothetical protein